jgi:hypothetical protein
MFSEAALNFPTKGPYNSSNRDLVDPHTAHMADNVCRLCLVEVARPIVGYTMQWAYPSIIPNLQEHRANKLVSSEAWAQKRLLKQVDRYWVSNTLIEYQCVT